MLEEEKLLLPTVITLLEQLTLKEENVWRRYKLKDTIDLVREELSKETVQICKQLWDEVKKLREVGNHTVIKYDKIDTRDFQHRL